MMLQQWVKSKVVQSSVARLSTAPYGLCRVQQPPAVAFSTLVSNGDCFPMRTQRIHDVSYTNLFQNHSIPPFTILSSSTRLFHSQSRRKKKKKLKPEDDPFYVLGFIQKKTTRVILRNIDIQDDRPRIPFPEVKARFLQIAMEHHPDTSKACTPNEHQEHRDVFVKARKAFEALVEAPDGMAILRSESAEHVEEEEDFGSWFEHETGHAMPYMSKEMMIEVAEVTEKVGGDMGLDRDGGMWLLARTVANTVKNGGGSADPLLRLEAGTVNREINGILRRRRKR